MRHAQFETGPRMPSRARPAIASAGRDRKLSHMPGAIGRLHATRNRVEDRGEVVSLDRTFQLRPLIQEERPNKFDASIQV
jgi:hypothetical protein